LLPDAYSLIAFTIIALFFSAIIRQISGFGFALVSMPQITLLLGIRIATPFVAITGVTVGLLMVSSNWQQADRRILLQLVCAALFGVPLGVILFGYLPEEWVKRGLGVLVLFYSLYALAQPQLPLIRNPWLTWVCGFVSGILTGAYNTGGPPVIVYGTLRHWSPEQFRSTLQLFFLLVSLLAMIGHGIAGLWTAEMWWLYLYSLPGLFLGHYLGDKLHRMIPRHMFSRVIYSLLIVTALVFLL
jgi:uncharacterized membrane protein YfcA